MKMTAMSLKRKTSKISTKTTKQKNPKKQIFTLYNQHKTNTKTPTAIACHLSQRNNDSAVINEKRTISNSTIELISPGQAGDSTTCQLLK
jgi:hypothetical protein